jgi:hypothetical protein
LHDEEKYKSLRNTLRHLPRLKAKKDFESRLMHRVKEAEKDVVESRPAAVRPVYARNWLANLFRPSFAPALALTAVLIITVVVYFAYFSKPGVEDTKQTAGSTDKGEFYIYVKKETGDSFSSNYPKEYSAITRDETGESEHRSAPTEMPSDYLSKPDPTRTLDSEVKPDRVSEEQKLEMQRSLDEKKGVETKGEREEDIIMKKAPKIEMKKEGVMEKESEMEKEGKDAPFNVRDEEKNVKEDKTEGYIEQKQEAPEKKANEVNKEVDQTLGKDSSRISRAVKDSLKTKTPKTEAEQEDSTDQK